MILVETSVFTRKIKELITDDDYKDLQEYLIAMPHAGDLIKHSGGVRKIRWGHEGKGKSGGVRVIYYWAVNESQILMLGVYPKSEKVNLTQAQIKALRNIVENWS
jgi:hypothetical protein